MKIGETIGKYIPEMFKKPFPIKAVSLEDFISIVESKGGSKVTAEFERKNIDLIPTFSTTVGELGNFKHSIIYRSTALDGRKIIFKQPCETKFGSKYGFSDADEREKSKLTVLVTADAGLKEIKEKLHGVSTAIIGPMGKMEQQVIEKMLSDAKRSRITPLRISEIRKK